MDPFTKGAFSLNSYQVEILDECLLKKSGGLALPMGAGKTLISLMLALQLSGDIKGGYKYILFVCSKSLVANCEYEISKFFGKSLHYEVFHPNFVDCSRWAPSKKSRLVITTADMIAKFYRETQLEQRFTAYFTDPDDPFILTKTYNSPGATPFLNHPRGGGYLFSVKWGCLIIDEPQLYTNINTSRCQGMGAICANYRWGLSGTMFDEPKVERILGYFVILDIPNTPRNLPAVSTYIYSPEYKGLRPTIVSRDTGFFILPKIEKIIVSHSLTKEEETLYLSMRGVIRILRGKVQEFRAQGDVGGTRRFSSFLLAMITYMRQFIICPLIPLASIALDLADFRNRSELSQTIMNEFRGLNLTAWLNDTDSVYSSRIREAVKTIQKHSSDRVIVFSCFRSCIEILEAYLPADRPTFSLTSKMNVEKRGETIEEFGESENGLLLLTYQLGAVGLNLQMGSVVLLLDFWWNFSKITQAIARVIRYGQTAKTVYVYFFTANTGIENCLFKKQLSKLAILDELMDGAWKTKIAPLKLETILNIIEAEGNRNLISEISKK